MPFARFASSHCISTALILGMLIALMSCSSETDRNVIDTGTSFTKEGTLSFVAPGDSVLRIIDIEIAETDAERARGLMFRRSMGYDKGMLFLFDEADESGFWMKNTPMPLDIIFVGPDSQVVSIAKRTKPFSEEQINPAAPKQFVVEVRAGFVDRFGVQKGTRIRWQRTD
jgi:uncharacterized membrane protein (UPF0127 family)